MKVTVIPDTHGMGHVVRSGALVEELRKRGHEATFAFVGAHTRPHLPYRDEDWLLLDHAEPPDPEMWTFLRDQPWRIALLNGQGLPGEDGADLVVIQGHPAGGKVKHWPVPARGGAVLQGARFVVLRQNLLPDGLGLPLGDRSEWLTYGGHGDELNVLPTLRRHWSWGARRLHLAARSWRQARRSWPKNVEISASAWLETRRMNRLLRRVRFGVIRFGMIAWELASHGIPCLAFYSEAQEPWARGMAERQWIAIPGQPGVPEDRDEFVQAIERALSLVPQPPLPDGRGARRIVDWLETNT